MYVHKKRTYTHMNGTAYYCNNLHLANNTKVTQALG